MRKLLFGLASKMRSNCYWTLKFLVKLPYTLSFYLSVLFFLKRVTKDGSFSRFFSNICSRISDVWVRLNNRLFPYYANLLFVLFRQFRAIFLFLQNFHDLFGRDISFHLGIVILNKGRVAFFVLFGQDYIRAKCL